MIATFHFIQGLIVYSILINLFLTTYTVVLGITVEEIWQQELADRNLNSTKQAFCYINRQGMVTGKNIDRALPIGSISKMITSLMAIDLLGPNYKFKTSLYYDTKEQWLHIQGGSDPLMSKRQWWYILNYLNQQEYFEVKKITFDENFYFFPNLFELSTYEHTQNVGNKKIIGPLFVNTQQIASWLSLFGQTTSWSKEMTSEYLELNQQFPQHFSKKLSFKIGSIHSLTSSQFNNIQKKNSLTQLITFESNSLLKVLKYINSYSNNPAADLLYHSLRPRTSIQHIFEKYQLEEYLSPNSQFITGSGIPLTTIDASGKSTRQVNLLSCRFIALSMATVHRLMNTLFDQQEKEPFPIPWVEETISSPKIFPLNGKEGTMRSYSFLPQSYVGKTGTLRLNKSLVISVKASSGVRHAVFLGEVTQISKKLILTQLYQRMIRELILRFDGARKILWSDFISAPFGPFINISQLPTDQLQYSPLLE